MIRPGTARLLKDALSVVIVFLFIGGSIRWLFSYSSVPPSAMTIAAGENTLGCRTSGCHSSGSLTTSSSDIALDDWTVYGAPRDCVETVQRARELGLDKIGFTIYSLPRDVQARIDYLQMIAEQILRPAGASLTSA